MLKTVQRLKECRKGQVGGLETFVIGLIIVGVVIVLGLYMLTEFDEKITDSAGATSVAANASDDVIEAVAELPGFLILIVLVVVMVIILGYMMTLRKTTSKA